jgi:hypothetical protein
MGAAIAIMWPGGAMVGQWLGNVINADLLGLDAAFPIILFCLIRGDLKNKVTLSLTVIGILIAVGADPAAAARPGCCDLAVRVRLRRRRLGRALVHPSPLANRKAAVSISAAPSTMLNTAAAQ